MTDTLDPRLARFPEVESLIYAGIPHTLPDLDMDETIHEIKLYFTEDVKGTPQTVRITDHNLRLIQLVIQSGLVPYKTTSDFIREAVAKMLVALLKMRTVNDPILVDFAISHRIEANHQNILQRAAHVLTSGHRLHEMVCDALAHDEPGRYDGLSQAVGYITDHYERTMKLHDPTWRVRHLNTVRESSLCRAVLAVARKHGHAVPSI